MVGLIPYLSEDKGECARGPYTHTVYARTHHPHNMVPWKGNFANTGTGHPESLPTIRPKFINLASYTEIKSPLSPKLGEIVSQETAQGKDLCRGTKDGPHWETSVGVIWAQIAQELPDCWGKPRTRM